MEVACITADACFCCGKGSDTASSAMDVVYIVASMVVDGATGGFQKQ